MAGRVILLAGKIGSGKSAIAEHLLWRHGFAKVKLAAPLKNMLRILGLNDDEIEGELKEVPCEALLGKTPRYAMQTLGTEWGRNNIHNNLWLHHAVTNIKTLVEQDVDVVVDDLRFINELHYLRVNLPSTKAYRITRPGGVEDSHISEQEIDLLTVDHVVLNTGTLEQLQSKADQLVKAYE